VQRANRHQRSWQGSRFQHRSRPTMPSHCGHPPGPVRPTASRAVRTVTQPVAGHRHVPEDLGNGQQLVYLTLAQRPDTILTTGDPATAAHAGCAPVAWWPPACRNGPWGAGPSVHDHARGAWHANLAGRRSRPVDPRSGAAPSARLVGRAGRGHARRPRAGQTSHRLPSPPALAWPPGQESRPPRRPVAAFVSSAPPPCLLQGRDRGRSLPSACPAGNRPRTTGLSAAGAGGVTNGTSWSTLPFVEAHVQARSRTSSGSRRSPLRPARQQLGQTAEDQELNDHSNQSEPSPRTLPTDHGTSMYQRPRRRPP
jgi:hypothetical protein